MQVNIPHLSTEDTKRNCLQPLANKICRNECTPNCFYAFILTIQKFYSPKEEDAGRRSTKGHNLQNECR